MAIDLYHALHGFLTVRGMGTTSLKANILQQLEDTREEVLYDILFYLHNAYYDLDRVRCLGIIF